MTHLHPSTGHRGFHGRLRRHICVPTQATGALTGDLGDKFVPQRGPPGPPRQTYLTHLCSDAGHQGLHRRLRVHTNIVTPARGVLTKYLEGKFAAQRKQLILLRENWVANLSSNAGYRGPHGRRRKRIDTPTRATGPITRDFFDAFASRRGPPGLSRET